MTCAQKMFTGVNSFSLLAIPFFILAGNIMNNGGIAIGVLSGVSSEEDFRGEADYILNSIQELPQLLERME